MATEPSQAAKWLQATYDESPLAIAFSRDGLMLDANPAYAKLFGYRDADELRGLAVLDQIAPSERDRIREIIARRASGGDAPARYRTRGLRKDGTEFPFEIMTRRIVVEGGALTMAFLADVSELQESEERFRTLSSAAFEGVFIHAEGKVVLANEAGALMYGYTPETMIGVSLMELTAPESRELVAENARRGVTEPYEAVAMRKDGSTFIGEGRGRSLVRDGAPIRIIVIRDVTEQKALAERMRHAQKLESLGALASGIAHDFNNILTVITNSVELAKMGGKDTATHLDNIGVAAARATELCRQMLAYAGKSAVARAAVDASTLADEMLGMLDASVGQKAALVRDLAPGLPMISGDATQIRQVVLNLVLNAAEAITTRGRVVVTTGAAEYGPGAFAKSVAGGDPKPGTYVHVDVRDDGIGMDAATVAHMFDPFFTTKLAGRGLGMATVLGIVRGHGGAIEVESHPGRGTRVRVFFPAGETAAAPRAKGVVLVVDDESGVRTTTKLLLEQLGFEAIVARDGHEALEIVRARGVAIDAVMLDRTMPRMDGVQTMNALREIAPSIPIVLTSGRGEISGLPDPPDAVLAKPYTTAEMLAVLRRVMAR